MSASIPKNPESARRREGISPNSKNKKKKNKKTKDNTRKEKNKTTEGKISDPFDPIPLIRPALSSCSTAADIRRMAAGRAPLIATIAIAAPTGRLDRWKLSGQSMSANSSIESSAECEECDDINNLILERRNLRPRVTLLRSADEIE